jgi:hypothetical protein
VAQRFQRCDKSLSFREGFSGCSELGAGITTAGNMKALLLALPSSAIIPHSKMCAANLQSTSLWPINWRSQELQGKPMPQHRANFWGTIDAFESNAMAAGSTAVFHERIPFRSTNSTGANRAAVGHGREKK